MNLVKKDAFDEYRFNQHWEADSDFQRDFPGGIKFEKDFPGDCADVFAAMFRRKWRYVDDDSDPHLRKFLESLKETEDYKSLRERTMRKAGPAFEAMKKIMEKYSREGRDSDPQRRRIAAREAAQDAQEAAEEYERVAATCMGCGEEFGEESQASESERIKTIQKLLKNDFARKIIDMAGRIQATAQHQIETKADRGETKLVGVEQGGNIQKILPSELCFAAQCFELFVYRMLEGQLMQYKTAGEQPMGYGPIIVCIDESGSMDGDKNLFAKAFLYGMWVVAMSQRREFWVVRFSTNFKTHAIKSVKDITAVLDAFLGGGTNYELPLQETVRIIEDAQGRNPSMKTADMIFLTDGLGSVSPGLLAKILAKKKQIQFKILSAMVVGARDMRYMDLSVAKNVLKQFSDELFDINNIYKDNEFVKRSLSIGGN